MSLEVVRQQFLPIPPSVSFELLRCVIYYINSKRGHKLYKTIRNRVRGPSSDLMKTIDVKYIRMMSVRYLEESFYGNEDLFLVNTNIKTIKRDLNNKMTIVNVRVYPNLLNIESSEQVANKIRSVHTEILGGTKLKHPDLEANLYYHNDDLVHVCAYNLSALCGNSLKRDTIFKSPVKLEKTVSIYIQYSNYQPETTRLKDTKEIYESIMSLDLHEIKKTHKNRTIRDFGVSTTDVDSAFMRIFGITTDNKFSNSQTIDNCFTNFRDDLCLRTVEKYGLMCEKRQIQYERGVYRVPDTNIVSKYVLMGDNMSSDKSWKNVIYDYENQTVRYNEENKGESVEIPDKYNHILIQRYGLISKIRSFFFNKEASSREINRNTKETNHVSINKKTHRPVRIYLDRKEYSTTGIIGYKICGVPNSEKSCILEMEIPDDALIAGDGTKKFRTNKVIPRVAYGVTDGHLEELNVEYVEPIQNRKFKYRMNQMCEEKSFDKNLARVCTRGLHYCVSMMHAIDMFGNPEMLQALNNTEFVKEPESPIEPTAPPMSPEFKVEELGVTKMPSYVESVARSVATQTDPELYEQSALYIPKEFEYKKSKKCKID